MAQAGDRAPAAAYKMPNASKQVGQHDFYGEMVCDAEGMMLAGFDERAFRLLAPAKAEQFDGRLVHVRGIVGSCGTLIAWSIEPL